jgi:phosphomannomutase
VVNKFDYAFAENGLTAYKLGQELASQSFITWLGEEKYKSLVKFILHYIADLDIPIKRSVPVFCCVLSDVSYRGTFVEFRNGMVNISPIGRNASYVQF